MRLMTRGVMVLMVALATMVSLLLPLGLRTALADDEDLPLVAATEADLQSETIRLTVEEGQDLLLGEGETNPPVADESVTFTGTKFKVVCQGGCSEGGTQISKDKSLVISSLDGNTLIKNVGLHFSYYYGDDHDGKLSVDAGSLSAVTFTEPEEEMVATITDVSAAGVTLSTGYDYASAGKDGPVIDEVTIFYYEKLANPLVASAVKATQTLTYKTSAQTLKAADVFKVSGAKGAVTYAKKSGNAGISVASDGKVTVKKGQAVGNYKVVFSVKAAGDATYEAATKDVAVTFAVNKAKNPIKASPVTKKVKASKVAKKAATVACPIKVTKQQGKLQYARVKSGSSKCLTVNKNSGKVTVKKGTPKGTYKIKVKVTAKGNGNYKAGSKTVKCTVKVV